MSLTPRRGLLFGIKCRRCRHDACVGRIVFSSCGGFGAECQELQAKISLIRTAIEPLEVAFAAIMKANGYKKAEEWGHRSQYWALNDDLSDLCLRETNLVDSMIKLQPKTPAGIAAVAAAFKADQNHFWKSPEADRDWDISLLPRFLDGLMDLGQRRPSPLC